MDAERVPKRVTQVELSGPIASIGSPGTTMEPRSAILFGSRSCRMGEERPAGDVRFTGGTEAGRFVPACGHMGASAFTVEKESRVSKMDLNGQTKRAGKRPTAAAVVVLSGACVGLIGCEADSYMDPSVVGRWEHTPSKMPILDRIASIEDEKGDLVEYSDPTPEDLIPKPRTYRFGPGDTLAVTLYDWVQIGVPEVYEFTVDARGFIEVPQLGRVVVQGKTSEELVEELQRQMRRLIPSPLASVQAKSQRESTFNLIGAVTSPGPYFIPKADYRLLEAVHAGGRFDDQIREVYVIRQVPLYDIATPVAPESAGSRFPGAGAQDSATPPSSTPSGEPSPDLVDIIDQIAGPSKDAPDAPQPDGTQDSAPGIMSSARAGTVTAMAAQDAPKAVIDLPEDEPARPQAGSRGRNAAPMSGWVYLNGQWVQVRPSAASSSTQGDAESQQVMTQRVIRVPMDQLLAGRQSVNIVVLPGDVIRVPPTESGLVFVSGQVARPGSYGIPAGGLTLKQALTSAGGLGSLAIPERVDLIRRVSRNEEATIRLNGRAIFEATQPDLFLKPNDQINVGTNFWALPLAVVRGGFRASYGFGFLLDRNFGNDVFGAPPDNRGF